MSHTPGPWKFKVVDETDSFLGCKRLDGGGGSTVIDLSDEWTGYRECGQDLQMTISKEDAALIAAAPEVLEALETIMDIGDKACRDIARAAIRKARGEDA
jgi:hypothetical protein